MLRAPSNIAPRGENVPLSQPADPQQSAPSNAPRVGVIGAGLAGLSCAFELKRAGAEVEVFEARARVGGRVYTLREPGGSRLAEGGGEFIASMHTTWHAYAKHFDLPLQPIDWGDGDAASHERVVELDGRKLTQDELAEMKADVATARELMNADASTIDLARPQHSINAAAWDQLSTGAWIDQLPIGTLGKRAMHCGLANEKAVPTHTQSYLAQLCQVAGGGLEEYWTGGEAYRCKPGNSALAEAFANALGPECLHMQTPVTRVAQHPMGVVLTATDGDHDFDRLVLAVPPSVWDKIDMHRSVPTPQMGDALKRIVWSQSEPTQEVERLGDALVTSVWPSQPGHGLPSAQILFSSGEQAQMLQAVPKSQRDAAYARELEQRFPGSDMARLPHQTVNWPQDPWTRAGYSFPAPGEITSFGHMWHEPAGRLHHAGEHTCYPFIGYMEGALRSGVRAACNVLAAENFRAEMSPP